MKDIQLHHEDDRDIFWKDLVAILTILHSLRHSLNEKVVYIYTDSKACKYMLINMRSKLSRPDLQLIINEMRKTCLQHEMIPCVEHIPGIQNIIPDALSRNGPIPNNLVHNCTIVSN